MGPLLDPRATKEVIDDYEDIKQYVQNKYGQLLLHYYYYFLISSSAAYLRENTLWVVLAWWKAMMREAMNDESSSLPAPGLKTTMKYL